MSIPGFTVDGILPPFVGENPGGHSDGMSPYLALPLDVVDRFGTTLRRCNILADWLQHRAELRAVGIVSGFQWLDGSFVEDKEPNDLDLVTFLSRPVGYEADEPWGAWVGVNQNLLLRSPIRARFKLDFFVVDMGGHPETIVDTARYWLGLFSHKRSTNQWKGMLKVRLDTDDEPATELLTARLTAYEAAQ